MMPKAWSLCTGAESNLRVLGEVEKSSFIAWPTKVGQSRLLPWKTMCSNLVGFDKDFYSNGSRVGLLIRLGYVLGLQSSNLVIASVLSDCESTECSMGSRFPCLSLSPEVCSISCPLSQLWYPIISSSVIPFSSSPQWFPTSGSFPVSWFFTSGGQSIVASTSASVLPVNIQGWFPLGLTGWLVWSPCCPRDSQESSPTA